VRIVQGYINCWRIDKYHFMPEKKTIERAERDKRQGKSASTQAGEFVKEQVDKIRAGKHGARNTKQAIAIGLSEARRSGVGLKPPPPGKTSEKTRKSSEAAYEKGQRHEPVSKTRSQATEKALKKEGTAAASPQALSKQAKSAAANRTASDRSRAAVQASATKGPAERSAAAKKAAKTRAKGR
jgi:hypothetical protein